MNPTISQTIVTITPVPVDRDTRTFKQAASLARHGYRSIVVEGCDYAPEPSQLDRHNLPFALISAYNRPPLTRETQPLNTCPKMNFYARLKEKCKNFVRLENQNNFLINYILLLKHILTYFKIYCFRPLRYIPRASLYYIHSPFYFPAVYILSKRYKAPFIYDAHDFYSSIEEKSAMNYFSRTFIMPFYTFIEKLCIKRAAAVITVSDGVKQLMADNFHCHPIVIRNCQDPRLDQPPPQSLRDTLHLSADDFLVAVIGNAKKGQAIKELLEAVPGLPPHVHIALVGRGYEELASTICALRLDQQVHIVPGVKSMEVVPFVESADAALLLYYPRSPNYLHCLPNGFFQSIMARLPILYPPLPEITRLAQPLQLGLAIDPCSPDAIRSGILALLQDAPQYALFKQNLSNARQHINWETEEQLLFQLVDQIISDAKL